MFPRIRNLPVQKLGNELITLQKQILRTSITTRYASTVVPRSSKAIKYIKAQKKRQKNEAIQARISISSDNVDPVFGRENTPFIIRIMAEIGEPGVLSHGYENGEVEKLLAAVEPTERSQIELSGYNEETFTREDVSSLENRREAVMRIISMKNANNKEKMKKALRLVREEFERFPGDTGSSEVQAGCLTVRILTIAKHAQEHKKDFANTRILRMLVQQRQSILRYLKRDKPERYYWAIEKLGLNDDAITKEFNLDRRYMQDHKFYGDKTLIKDSKRVIEQKRKDAKKQRQYNL